MAGFPKYHELICNTYTPDFTAGPAPCVLQQGSERRSRSTIGGSHFRSVETGTINNGIIIECVIVPLIGDEQQVTFNYTDADGVPQTPIVFTQEYDATGTPPTCVSNGINQLRSALVSNSIITMPTKDYDADGVTVLWDVTVDELGSCLLSSFGPINMSGASGPPAPSSAIRTGPAYTLYYIPQSEDGTIDGKPVTVDKIVEWDGNNWVDHPSPLYNVGDPVTCP